MRIRFKNLSGNVEIAEVSRVIRQEVGSALGLIFELLFVTPYHTVCLDNLYHNTEDDQIEEIMLVKGFYDFSTRNDIIVKYK